MLKIQELNDFARAVLGLTCRVEQTDGICALPPKVQAAIRERVRTFNDFTESNDPHGEHDFGAFEYAGHRVFWKIDYYAAHSALAEKYGVSYGSEDPADPEKTRRVLTIMLAEEY